MNWEDIIVEAALTDTGMRRSNNQDSYAIVRAPNSGVWKERGHVFMVADGMGAHAVGELASKMACDNIPHNYTKTKNASPVEAVTKAYREVGAQIHTRATANREFQGMGTTCSTLILLPAGALIAHVGDSRVYRIRADRIEQLSFDHSLVWELVRRNHLSPAQAEKAVPKNVITRSLGPDPTVEVDIEGPHAVEYGDIYVLCSDGLSGPVLDPEIGAFAANFHPEDACSYLVNLANLRGGLDNVTTIVLRIGPWTDPRTGVSTHPDAVPPSKAKPNGRGFKLSSLISFSRKPTEEPAEEHVYQAADCAIDDALLHKVGETVRHAQAQAVEQTWNLDWPKLANLRREAEAARAEDDSRGALRCFGEAIGMLGRAARQHRKDQG